jgi:hypothetical protein
MLRLRKQHANRGSRLVVVEHVEDCVFVGFFASSKKHIAHFGCGIAVVVHVHVANLVGCIAVVIHEHISNPTCSIAFVVHVHIANFGIGRAIRTKYSVAYLVVSCTVVIKECIAYLVSHVLPHPPQTHFFVHHQKAWSLDDLRRPLQNWAELKRFSFYFFVFLRLIVYSIPQK